ncbi:recombinase family protein [Chloroflexota bacterium]
MKAAIYCRVSTDNQEREGTSLQTQLENCLTYCRDKGYDVSYRFCEAYSGLSLERPELDRLRELGRAEQIDVVVCYSLDRLTRDPGHGVIIMQEIEKHKVALEAVTEDVDNSELGKLISYIRGFASKVEAEKIRERTMRGKKAFLKMGKLPAGTGKGLYGYKWDKENKRRIPLELESKIVEKIFNMVASGEGYNTIARTLNDLKVPTKTGSQWSPRTIYNMTGKLSYVGMTYYGKTRGSTKTKQVKQPESEWTFLPDATPSIISKELFERVQEIRQRNGELHKAKAKHDYVLKGHVFCGSCGTSLVGSFMNRKYRYYHCRATYPTVTRLKECNARYIQADYLEEVVWKNINNVLLHPDLVLAAVKEQLESEQKDIVQNFSFEKEIQKLRKQINGYDAQEKRLVQLFRYGEISQDSILDEINSLKKEIESDRLKLDNLVKTKGKIAKLKKAEIKLSDYCNLLMDRLSSAGIQEKRDILDMLAIKVTATVDAIDIEGIIPLKTVPSGFEVASVEPTHHCTNMGIITCV